MNVLSAAVPLDNDRIDEVRVWTVFAASTLTEPALREVNTAHNREWVDRVSSLIGRLHPDANTEDISEISKLLVSNVNGIALTAAPTRIRTRPIYSYGWLHSP